MSEIRPATVLPARRTPVTLHTQDELRLVGELALPADGGEEIPAEDRDRLELALAAALHRSGDLPGSQEMATRVGRRALRRRDRLWLARTALAMEATGVPEWDGEICRICEQALAGDDLPDDLWARVSSQYRAGAGVPGRVRPRRRDEPGGAVPRRRVGRSGRPCRHAPGPPAGLLRPEGHSERVVLAGRMLEAADALGSAWVEMWGRLWRIDTLFETGQLRNVRPRAR